jgi:hypothetical protein
VCGTYRHPVVTSTVSDRFHLKPDQTRDGRKSRRRKLNEKDDFECGVREGEFKGQDPFDDLGVINTGAPAKQQALAVIYRGNMEIMQCISTYYSPWYENGNGKEALHCQCEPPPVRNVARHHHKNTHEQPLLKNRVTMYVAWVGTYRTGPSDGARNRYDPIT